jgi:mycothiol system anti-sigma-R factor
MSCEKTRHQVYGYLDKEMTWYRRARIRWHLRRCPPCADGFDFELALKARVRKDCSEEPPEELLERLRTFLREQGPG